MHLDFDLLYRLETVGRRTTLHLDSVESEFNASELFHGVWVPPAPLTFYHQSGHRALDFLGTTWGFLSLISEKVVQTLTDAKLTGWSTYDVIAHGRDGAVLPGYRGLSVTGRCGPLLPERSERVQRPSPVGAEFTVERLLGQYFDPATWDGSDVFSAEKTALVLLSERAYVALRDAKLTNVTYTPLSQMEWM